MKKNFFKGLLRSLFISALVFAAAPAFAFENANFHPDMDSGLAAAKKSSKNILIFITQEGEDELSASFLKTVTSDEVLNQITPSYELVGMDFSQKSFEKTVVHDVDSPENQQLAKKAAEDMQKNSRFAALINPEFTPAVYLFTGEGYYVSHLLLKGNEDAAAFMAALKADEVKLAALRLMVEKTKTGKPLEKVAAIDEIFEATQPEYRFFIIDLVNTALNLDKKNKSGYMNKYIITKTEYDAMIAFYNNDAKAAMDAYEAAGKNKMLTKDERQQAYYMAALVLVKSSGPETIPQVLDYLQKSLDAAPASKNAPQIKENMEYFKNYKVEGGKTE